MEKGLFREEGVRQLGALEELDRRLIVARRRDWLVLVGGFVLLAMLLAWSILGSLETTVGGRGIVLRQGGAFRIVADAAGSSPSVTVEIGDVVAPGEVLVAYRGVGPDGRARTIEARNPYPERARVIEILISFNDVVSPGTPLLALEFADRPLEVVMYVDAVEGREVSPGMRARISLASYSPQEYGFVTGVVAAVAPFPSTTAGMLNLIGNEGLVEQFYAASNGAPLMITLLMDERATNPSGVIWSSGSGPEGLIGSGEPTTIEIIVEKHPPIAAVVPGLR